MLGCFVDWEVVASGIDIGIVIAIGADIEVECWTGCLALNLILGSYITHFSQEHGALLSYGHPRMMD